jgi:hypothetical protein
LYQKEATVATLYFPTGHKNVIKSAKEKRKKCYEKHTLASKRGKIGNKTRLKSK